jgi:hypothetical protein
MVTDTLLRLPETTGGRHFATRRRQRRVSDLLAVVGIALWAYALTTVDLARMGDTGLISVLPPVGLLGLALVGVGFVTQVLTDSTDRWRPGTYIVALVVMLDGLPCFLEATGSIPTGYLHVGFAQYILQHGKVLDNYDARFSWPGMFAWSALGTVAGGQRDAMVYLRWAPVVLDLLYLVPLRLILRRCCADPRIAWIAAAVFVLANWTEQDYFSPQGFAYVAYLTVIAVVLVCSERAVAAGGGAAGRIGRLRASLGTVTHRLLGRDGRRLALPTTRARIGVTVLLAVVVASVVTSHQLTPYALIIELIVLLAFGRLASPSLLVLLGVLSIGYLSLGAENFWAGHLSDVFGGVGQVGTSVSSGVVQRTHVSEGHELVVGGRLVYTAVLVAIGGLGALIRRRRTGDRGLVAAMALAPWTLAGVQSYGGEVFIRSLFLSLPFLAILVAEVAVWVAQRARRAGAVALTVGVVTSSVALIVTRYGNEPFYRTTATEIQAVRWADSHASDGATLAVLDQNLPWRFEDVGRLNFVSYQALCPAGVDLGCLEKVRADEVIITQGQLRFAELEGGVLPSRFAQFDEALTYLGYQRRLDLPDAQVWVHAGSSFGPHSQAILRTADPAELAQARAEAPTAGTVIKP